MHGLISFSKLLGSNHLLWQTSKNSTNKRHRSANNNQSPVHDLLRIANLLSKQFQMKCQRQYNAYGETADTSQERHDAVKGREDNRNANKDEDDEDADGSFEKTTIEARHANHRGRLS